MPGRDRCRLIRISALVILALAAFMFVPHRAVADVPAEMKVLERFVGTRMIKQSAKTGDGREIRATGFTTTRLVLEGRCLIARFEAERQALAMMDHPNIARVLAMQSHGTMASGPGDCSRAPGLT